MPREININEKIEQLRQFLARENRMPGYNEMLKIFNYRSKNGVFGTLARLQEEGYITKKNGKIAATSKLHGGIRLLGAVQAGFPTPAEEELLDTLTLDEFLIEKPESTFLLNVTGDSMIDAGIHPGDMVLVQKGTPPKTGDIVVAEVDGDWTLKYFAKDSDGIRLDPANKKYKAIRPKNSLEIGGIVKSVIRKY